MIKAIGTLFSPRARLGLALVGATLSLVLAAQFFGLLPDETKSEIEARSRVAEALAIQLANAASRRDMDVIEMTIASVVARNKDVRSIAVREIGGSIVVGSGDHPKYWPDVGFRRSSTPSHVRVPLYRNSRQWGQIEIAFTPLRTTERLLGLPLKMLYFLAFLAVTVFLATELLLRRTLRVLDPNQAIPGRVQAAFDTMAEGVLILDRSGTVVLVNRAFNELTGLASNKLFGRTLSALPWQDKETAQPLDQLPWELATKEGQAQTNVSLSLSFDASKRYLFVVNATPVCDQDGSVQGVIVTFDDVTVLERKNEELKRAVGQLQDLSSKLEERVTERTRAAEEAAAATEEANKRLRAEVVERSRAEAAVAEQRDSLIRQQSALSGLAAQMQQAGLGWRNSIAQLTEACGRQLGAGRVGIWLDIDQEGVYQCVDRYDAAKQSHLAGGEIAAGDAPNFFAQLSEGAAIVLPGQHGDAHQGEFAGMAAQVAQTGSLMALPILRDGHLDGIMILENPDEERAWGADHQVFATAIANLASLVLEARERQRIEDNLRTTNTELVAATEAKSQFLANMSHELRTPMNGVFGMTDLLLRTSLNERQHKLVSTISQSAKSLLVIINDILDLSKIENGRMALETHDFDLYGCVEDVVDLLAEQAHKKGLGFNLFIDAEQGGPVTGDSGRLRQVLLNLVGNAIKFTNQGDVSVRVEKLQRSGANNACMLRFEVIDTGIGISAAVQKELFKPFSQADSSISRRFGGTGLGLSISKHLVTLMGGRIEMESQLGVGTRVWFDIELPQAAQEPGQSTATSKAISLSGSRILIVDESPAGADILTRYAGALGADTVVAPTIAEAISELMNATRIGRAIDLAIVDFELDRSNNYAFGQLSGQGVGFTPPPRVWMASVMEDAASELARIEPAASIVNKPIHRHQLQSAISEALARSPSGDTMLSDSAAAGTMRSGLKVLVAEDNAINQFVTVEYLEEMGCIPVVVENGRQAVEHARQEAFDLILMDFQMPEMDGLTAAKLIAGEKRKAGLPVPPIVAVTGNVMDEDLVDASRSAMVAHIAKPYSSAQLRDVVLKWTSRSAGSEAGAAGRGPAQRRALSAAV